VINEHLNKNTAQITYFDEQNFLYEKAPRHSFTEIFIKDFLIKEGKLLIPSPISKYFPPSYAFVFSLALKKNESIKIQRDIKSSFSSNLRKRKFLERNVQ